MTSLKPYLIRAIYAWIVDNQMTPYVVVSADSAGGAAPNHLVEEGKIILNLRPAAVQGLCLGDDRIEFNARFGGVPTPVAFPVAAVLAIYAKENGQGMVFEQESSSGDVPPDPGSGKVEPKKPVLTVVK